MFSLLHRWFDMFDHWSNVCWNELFLLYDSLIRCKKGFPNNLDTWIGRYDVLSSGKLPDLEIISCSDLPLHWYVLKLRRFVEKMRQVLDDFTWQLSKYLYCYYATSWEILWAESIVNDIDNLGILFLIHRPVHWFASRLKVTDPLP